MIYGSLGLDENYSSWWLVVVMGCLCDQNNGLNVKSDISLTGLQSTSVLYDTDSPWRDCDVSIKQSLSSQAAAAAAADATTTSARLRRQSSVVKSPVGNCLTYLAADSCQTSI